MSRFRKLSQTIWHCQYHVVFVPKYRLRILSGRVGQEVANSIRAFAQQQHCEVVELNVQVDHVHLLIMVPPKVSISAFVGTIKGRSAIRVFNKFQNEIEHYMLSTTKDMIRKYVKYQEIKERCYEQKQGQLF